jgi:hypothetical protein
MPTNVYFDTGTKPEQHLYEDLMIEQLKIYGQDVYYIPRTLIKEDNLLGEDVLSKFGDAYQIEMYFENVEGYEGEKEIMSKFGLQMQDDATFVVAKRRFEQLVSGDSNLSKFEGVQMLGGVTLNGAKLFEEANADIEKLEEQIQLAYELPPNYMIG